MVERMNSEQFQKLVRGDGFRHAPKSKRSGPTGAEWTCRECRLKQWDPTCPRECPSCGGSVSSYARKATAAQRAEWERRQG